MVATALGFCPGDGKVSTLSPCPIAARFVQQSIELAPKKEKPLSEDRTSSVTHFL